MTSDWLDGRRHTFSLSQSVTLNLTTGVTRRRLGCGRSTKMTLQTFSC